jgi:pentatricopeptide repeat protein
MQVFRRMEAADVTVDVIAYNSAIAACAKGGDWEQAWAVFSSEYTCKQSAYLANSLSTWPVL